MLNAPGDACDPPNASDDCRAVFTPFLTLRSLFGATYAPVGGGQSISVGVSVAFPDTPFGRKQVEFLPAKPGTQNILACSCAVRCANILLFCSYLPSQNSSRFSGVVCVAGSPAGALKGTQARL
jgi:hypothetical protein